jgi:hypothetical protein
MSQTPEGPAQPALALGEAAPQETDVCAPSIGAREARWKNHLFLCIALYPDFDASRGQVKTDI